MGPYPHDGRVTIETYDNNKREFIILGNQSGKSIANLIPAIHQSSVVSLVFIYF